MKKLVLSLTADQFGRLAVLAELPQSKPEHVVLGAALGTIEMLREDIEFYIGDRRASTLPRGRRLEDRALASYDSLVAGSSEVRHE